MADVIELRGQRAVGICGALPEERERAQPLEVDLDVHADLSAAAVSDDLADTIDYGALCTAVDPRIEAVTVWVRKLRPPVPQQLATSGIRLHRERAQG